MLPPNTLKAVTAIDRWLDECVSKDYREREPMAQDWARVCKITEEHGEAIDALIRWTGQNPRKPQERNAYHEMLTELADVWLTAMLAIQHFTKDANSTDSYLGAAVVKAAGRAIDAGYPYD